KKLFWPFDKNAEHKESKLWGGLGHFTWTRPILSLGIIALITAPILFIFKGEQTYDNLAELDDGFDTVVGFDWIEKGFGPGEIMPITIVMELEDEVDDVASVQGLETIANYVADIDGITKVRSVTRPSGDIIDDFLLETQTDVLTEGLDEMMDGLTEFQDGLSEASDELKDQAQKLKNDQEGVQQLIDGTNELKDGINDIQSGVSENEKGLRDGSVGLNEAIAGLEEMQSGLNETINAHKELLEGYKGVTSGLEQAEKDIQNSANIDIDFDIEGMMAALDGLEQSIDGMNQVTEGASDTVPNIPEYQEAYQSAKHIISEMKSGMQAAAEDMKQLDSIDVSFQELIQPLKELNKGYEQTITGQEQIASS